MRGNNVNVLMCEGSGKSRGKEDHTEDDIQSHGASH
jgi:hypothetical protein